MGRELKELRGLKSEWKSLKIQIRPLRQPRTNRQIPVLFISCDNLDEKPKWKALNDPWQNDPSEYGKLKQNPDDKGKSYWRVGIKDASHVGIVTMPENAKKAVKFFREWRRLSH